MSKGDGQPYESLVTVGMRGDGDEPMAEGTAIAAAGKHRRRPAQDHRRRDRQTRRADAAGVGALQGSAGLLRPGHERCRTTSSCCSPTTTGARSAACPTRRDPASKGGYGVYYHFDYVGGPRNYKWINTNQIEKTWQQMDLAYRAWRRGAVDRQCRRHQADGISARLLHGAGLEPGGDDAGCARNAIREAWATRDLRPGQVGRDRRDLVTRYSQYAARRKPELIDADSFRIGERIGDTLDAR